jgi:hypothetical protein
MLKTSLIRHAIVVQQIIEDSNARNLSVNGNCRPFDLAHSPYLVTVNSYHRIEDTNGQTNSINASTFNGHAAWMPTFISIWKYGTSILSNYGVENGIIKES